MIEITLKENNTGRKIEIEEMYKLENIPLPELDVMALSLESIVYEMLAKNEKNRKYESKRKQKV